MPSQVEAKRAPTQARTPRRRPSAKAELARGPASGPVSGPAAGPRAADPIRAAFSADHGIAKSDAARLFQTAGGNSAVALGKLRAELIPDSSWKRAGKTLGPQASQTAARLGYILSFAERVWGNQPDATEWLNTPHAELRGATPYSMLKTEAGGRAVEALLGALEFGFPV
jgi:putative toxin-antitoxin system antitoxin component (TIGR02293 family)